MTLPFNNSDENIPGQGLSSNEFDIYTAQELNFIVAVCSINIILSFAALFGNSVILISIWKTSSLHSASNIVLSSLAVSDLTVGLVVQPLYAVFLLFARRIDTDSLFHLLAAFPTLVSFLNITAIGVDRLLALQLHLRYEAVVTPFRVKLQLIFIWLLCAVVVSSLLWIRNLRYYLLSTIFVSLFVGNLFVYFKIYLIVRRHERQIQQQQQANKNRSILTVTRLKKSSLNTFLVFILLMCCYLAYSVYLALGNVFNLTRVSVTTVTLVYLNSSLNPLLYCWRDRQIRTAVKQLLCG